MAEIKFSPDALSDLKGIKAYIAEELLNEQAAANTVSVIMKHIRQLSDFPESAASLSNIVHFDMSYRYLACGNYTVCSTFFISTPMFSIEPLFNLY